MMRVILACLTAVVFLLGCANTGGGESENDSSSERPAWVVNPEKSGYLSVVGSAPQQDWGGYQAQYRVAMMKARQELAQMVRVQVESTTLFSVEERSGEVSRTSDIETRLRSNTDVSLDEARVIEEWVDPQTGELYLWLVIPK